MEGTDMPLAETLRRLRQAKDMTQQALAMAAGLSVSAVVQLENGTNKDPRMSTLRGIASALGVSVDTLMSDNGDAAPSRPAKRKRGK